jgi:SAM-dependent methyltransferase
MTKSLKIGIIAAAVLIAATFAGVLVYSQISRDSAPTGEIKKDVPYVPTAPETVKAMLEIANVGKDDIVYDLGCGDGRIVIAAVKDFGAKKAVGVDIDPQRIKEANENAKAAGVQDKVKFIQGDLFKQNFSEATVVTLYLLPSVNLKLRPKLIDELKPGTRVVSHDFDMGDWKPEKTQSLEGDTVYFWTIPQNKSSVPR